MITRQIIRCRKTTTIRRLQINKTLVQKERVGYKAKRDTIEFWQVMTGCTRQSFRKIFRIRDANNFA